MVRGVRNALIGVTVFMAGVAGGLVFKGVESESVCEDHYIEETYHYSEATDDFGHESEGAALSAESVAMKVDAPEYTVQQPDAESRQWVVSKDGTNVAAFSLYQTESRRFVIGSRLACVLGDGITPVDANLDLSRMTDFMDSSAHLTEEAWRAQQEAAGSTNG